MHELTIAFEIMRVVKDSLSREQLRRLSRISLQIGRATAVQEDCLRFALEAVMKDGELPQAEVDIKYVEPVFKCRECTEEFSPEVCFFSPCPKCGSFRCEMLKGNELLVSCVDLK